MKIVVKTPTGKLITLDTNPNEKIESIISTIEKIEGIKDYQQNLSFKGLKLDKGKTLKDYNITDNSVIEVILRRNFGGLPSARPSRVIGKIANDDGSIPEPLPYGTLSTRFIRNTNATGVYEQEVGNCYAFAAASAYINTIERIYGHTKPIPPFKECFDIANYNGGEGGNPSESIRLLEEHYQFGIKCEPKRSISIREAMMLSVIVAFGTSNEGWDCLERGDLKWHPGGASCGGHGTLIEGYDLNKDCMIGKNSWGGEDAEPRFDFTPSACHWCYFYTVYFTIDSIRGKTNKKYVENIQRFNGTLKGKQIHCAWMDYHSALYSSEFVCEHHPEKDGPLKYLGYNVQEWIDINLNRPKDKEYPKYHYINNIQCA